MRRVLGWKQFAALLLMVAALGATATWMAQAQTGGVRQAEVRADAGYITDVILCGQLGNATTVYASPVSGFADGNLYGFDVAIPASEADLDYHIGGQGCDTEDSATEATADEIMFANNTFKVLAMYCAVSSSGANGVTINLRSAAANLAPNITVTIATAKTTAVTNAFTTTDVAANATFAARAITTEDLSAQDFWCIAKVLVVP